MTKMSISYNNDGKMEEVQIDLTIDEARSLYSVMKNQWISYENEGPAVAALLRRIREFLDEHDMAGNPTKAT